MRGQRGPRGTSSSYLDEFFANPKKVVHTDPSTKYSIAHNSYDRQRVISVMDEVREMAKAEIALGKITPTSEAAMSDTFLSVYKSQPQRKPTDQVRPSHRINSAVMGEAMKLKEWDKLRAYSVLDPVQAGLSAAEMEPELETIFDRLREQQERSERIEEMMDQYVDDSKSVDDLVDEMVNGDGSVTKSDVQEAKDALAQLEQQIRDASGELDATLAELVPGSAPQLQKAMGRAQEQAELSEAAAQMWGSARGGLKKMPTEKRLELAERLKNERFRRMAQLFGPMLQYAMGIQRKRVNNSPQEAYDVELGNSLQRMLPTELISLAQPQLRGHWMHRYVEKRLLQYRFRGKEKLAKGGIIVAEDGSGSMSGGPEIWAKAVSLALLKIAEKQKRPFDAIHFGGPGEYKLFSFTTNTPTLASETFYNGRTEHLTGIDAILDFAECHFAGGTDFRTPLDVALAQLQEQHREFGAVKGDIVFITDGQCYVPDDWLANFKEEQERLGFRVFGIAIGCDNTSEPLATICDGKVVNPKNLMTGQGLEHIFSI